LHPKLVCKRCPIFTQCKPVLTNYDKPVGQPYPVCVRCEARRPPRRPAPRPCAVIPPAGARPRAVAPRIMVAAHRSPSGGPGTSPPPSAVRRSALIQAQRRGVSHHTLVFVTRSVGSPHVTPAVLGRAHQAATAMIRHAGAADARTVHVGRTTVARCHIPKSRCEYCLHVIASAAV